MEGTTVLGTGQLNNGTATASISGLSAGSHTLFAVYAGDSKFAGSTSATVTATVSKVNSSTALAATPNPSSSGQPVTLRATVTPPTATGTVTFMEGATVLGSNALSGGVASITFTFSTGSHSLTANYPGDGNTNSSSGQTTLVTNPTGPALGNISPSTLPDAFVGVPYSQQFTVTGGALPLTWVLVSGSVVGVTLSPAGLLSGTPTTAGSTPLGIQVRDNNGAATGFTPTLRVLAVPAVSITAPQPTTLQDQPTPQVSIPGFSDPLTATFALTFAADASVKGLPTPYTNPDVLFPTGTTTSAAVNVPANSTAAVSVQPVQLGSVAGVVTVRLATLLNQRTGQSLPLPSPVPATTITVRPAAPVITSVKIVGANSGATSFQVVVIGASTTRDLTTASLTFSAASGAQLNGATQTVSLTAASAAWFVGTGNASLGKGAGGAFTLTMTFPFSGDASAIGTVSVTLANSVGTSPAVSGGR
jgi:hypothetical protein